MTPCVYFGARSLYCLRTKRKASTNLQYISFVTISSLSSTLFCNHSAPFFSDSYVRFAPRVYSSSISFSRVFRSSSARSAFSSSMWCCSASTLIKIVSSCISLMEGSNSFSEYSLTHSLIDCCTFSRDKVTYVPQMSSTNTKRSSTSSFFFGSCVWQFVRVGTTFLRPLDRKWLHPLFCSGLKASLFHATGNSLRLRSA